MLNRRSLRRDDEAVSTVVSAVLVFGLVVMVLDVYMSQIVPEQVADAEATHMRDVASSLTDVASEISAAINLDREGEFTKQINLGTTTLPGISMFHSSGSLAVKQNAYYANFICSSPKLIARDGDAAAGGTFAALGPAADFHTLSVFAIRVSSYSFGPTDDTATIRITSNGAEVGRFELRLVAPATLAGVRVRTFEAANPIPVYDQTLQSGVSTISSYIVDALAPAYGFRDILGDAQGTLRFETSATTGALTGYAVYWKPDGSLAQLGTGRTLLSGFQRNVNPTSLFYQASNNKFLDQTYSLEGGAIVLGQEAGQHLQLRPFAIQSAGGQRLLRLSLVNMTGEGAVSGSNQAAVNVIIHDPTTSTLDCTDPTLLVSSEYPIAWHAAWADELARAGLSESQVTTTSSVVSARLTGAWKVILDEARITVRLA